MITSPGARGAVRASLLRFLPLKELKRNMGCLETAVASQERDKGNIQFASRLPNPDNQKGASDSEQNFCPETKIVHMAYMSLVLQ